MPTANQYGSITETFMGNPFLVVNPLSLKATPPADLALVPADVAPAVNLFSGSVSFARDRFFLGDIPRIVGVGVWCNLADGLVQIDAPDDFDTGLVFAIAGQSFNMGSILQQANILVPNLFFKVQEFNQIFEVDHLLDMSTLDYTLTGPPTQPQVAGGYFTLTARLAFVTANFSTISLDPTFATKPLYMRPMVVIEHSYPLFL